MRDDSGYLIVVKGDHEVLSVSGVLGADATADAALLRVETAQLHPLPLTEEVEVGDPVFCLSEPSGERPYFSAGIVNRFARDADVKKNTPRAHRINVSTDWAPGSSGSAVLDACGNAIGHVGSISSLGNHPKGNEKPAHYMTLHWAIPAKHVLELARTPATRAETATTSDPAR
jgi:S1-C subfamily serine protease